MYNRLITLLLVFVFVELCYGIPVTLKDQITIQHQDASGIEFTYEPDYFIRNSQASCKVSDFSETDQIRNLFSAPNTVELTIHALGSDFVLASGQPEIPVTVLTIAIPPNSSPQVHVKSSETGLRLKGTLKNFDEQTPDPAGESNATFFQYSGNVIGQPEYSSISGVRIMRLPIYPVQYAQNDSRIDIASKISLSIDFGRSSTPSRYATSSKPVHLNRLAELVLLNPQQAAGWKKVQTTDFLEFDWPQGFLYTFDVDHEAIYKLTYEDLISKGVRLGGGTPSGNIKIFSNGGGTLDEDPRVDAPIGLKECALYIHDGGDGTFSDGDWLIFYGRGASIWKQDIDWNWVYETNPYTAQNTYWFNIDPSGGGVRMAEIPSLTNPDTTVTSAPARLFHEPERFIWGRAGFVGSGRSWYGYTFDGTGRFSMTVNPKFPDPDKPVLLRLRAVNSLAGSGSPLIKVSMNDTQIDQFTPGVHYNLDNSTEQIELDGELLRSTYNTLTLEQTRSAASALFDWYDLHYYSKLEGSLTFESYPYNGTIEYSFNNLSDPWIFDITRHNHVEFIRGSSIVMREDMAEPRRYYCMEAGSFLSITSSFDEYLPPEADVPDLWSTGNNADVVVITPDVLYDELEPLIEYYGNRNPGLSAVRVHLSEIYNRFSGGLQDPTAIRNFLHYTFDGGWSKAPDYVVFCGDGDYNYRNIDRSALEVFMPPYEDEYSARCADDWFTDFDHTDYSNYLPDIVHGRIPVTSAYELRSFIDKIIAYDLEPDYGPWRNHITLVADDEFGDRSVTEDEHVRVQEELANIYMPSYLDKEKIYLTEYEAEIGREKTQAANDLVRAINEGTLLVNYLGHGNPTLWAHEHVFTQARDLPRIEKNRKLAMFVAFTCDWAYWDNPQSQSFPEQLVVENGRGAIAAIASTRLTYAFSNSALARNFYSMLFNNENLTIGEALAAGKYQALIQLGPTYHLLGDPTLYLGSPKLTGTLNHPDPYPLKPLAKSSISGTVNDQSFSGTLDFLVNDTQIDKVYNVVWTDANGNEHVSPINYLLPGSLVYRGQFSVDAGQFDGSFVVPLDVTLGSTKGRITGYFFNDETDGVVVIDSVQFAGSAEAAQDTTPPEITVFFDHRGYRPGDPIGSEPKLIVDVEDESGLNLTGKMGHGISVIIDGGNPIDLTDNFSYQMDSYTEGSLEQQIGPLEEGLHTLEMIAWDSFNNFAVQELEIEVTGSDEDLRVERVLNLPNPFSTSTQLTFVVNKPADYDIYIYTVAGRKIWDTSGETLSSGIVTDIIWDGTDYHGNTVGNGVYLYKVIARDEDGSEADGLGRIALVR